MRWHHQWPVVHDYVRRSVGQDMLDAVLGTDGQATYPQAHRLEEQSR